MKAELRAFLKGYRTAQEALITADVFQHPTNGYLAVKRGFCWEAALFTIFWAFAKRLWLAGFAALAIDLILLGVTGLSEFTRELLGNCGLGLLFGALFGFKGNEWLSKVLAERGWTRVATVQANNCTEAVAKVREQAGVWTEEDARLQLVRASQAEGRGHAITAIRLYEDVVRRFPGSEAATDADASLASLRQRIGAPQTGQPRFALQNRW
jgi:hypothetical protein